MADSDISRHLMAFRGYKAASSIWKLGPALSALQDTITARYYTKANIATSKNPSTVDSELQHSPYVSSDSHFTNIFVPNMAVALDSAPIARPRPATTTGNIASTALPPLRIPNRANDTPTPPNRAPSSPAANTPVPPAPSHEGQLRRDLPTPFATFKGKWPYKRGEIRE